MTSAASARTILPKTFLSAKRPLIRICWTQLSNNFGSTVSTSVTPVRLRPVFRPIAAQSGAEDAELVALGVGEDDPGFVSGLTHIDTACSEIEEAGHLGVPIIVPEIEVESVLHDLLFPVGADDDSRQAIGGPAGSRSPCRSRRRSPSRAPEPNSARAWTGRANR